MWLISNPLFEIGAGLVLIAATVWMLLNATAPRPALPKTIPAPPPAPLAPPAADPAAILGPLTGRAPRSMFLADEEPALAEPPLRLAPDTPPSPPAPPPLEMRLPEIAPAPIAVQSPVTETPALEPAVQAAEPTSTVAEAAPIAEEPPPPSEPPIVEAPEPEPLLLEQLAPDPLAIAAAAELAHAEIPEAGEPVDLAEPPPAGETTAEPAREETAIPFLAAMPTEPEAEPPPSLPFEARYQDWLEGLLRPAPGAPPLAMVAAAAARVKRGVDPSWPEPVRDLRAAIECLGKLAPAVFAAHGAREATAALAETIGAPFALIWPEAGSAFDPARHEARSGEGEAVAAVVRPGVAYGAASLPALVVKGSASPSSASA